MKGFQFVTLLLLFGSIRSRIFQSTYKASALGKNKSWIYLDKMSFQPGTANY